MTAKLSATITLTTDFGCADWFAGTLKGVIGTIAPQARVIDLSHEIPAGDVKAGAFALLASYRFFPRGSLHLVVVDPGVGTARRAIAVQTGDYWFVAPDNGVLSWALAREKIVRAHELKNRRYSLPVISRTFHGRDIFAPAAAHLVAGVPMGRLGPEIDDYLRLDFPAARRIGHEIRGEVLYIDRFGNAITNIDLQRMGTAGEPRCVLFEGRRSCPVADAYDAVPPGQPVALVASSGFLEIAVNRGSANRKLGLRVGTLVRLRLG